MCEFISWIELDNNLYYLTKKELRTKRGKELHNYLGEYFAQDIKGHGAIDYYYELQGKGVRRECTDLSNPQKFPPEIVQVLKNGGFEGIGIREDLLTDAAWAEYVKIRNAEWAEYEKIKNAARAEYVKTIQTEFWKLVRDPNNRVAAWK